MYLPFIHHDCKTDTSIRVKISELFYFGNDIFVSVCSFEVPLNI
jgi:hypothetical protein